MSGAAVIKVAVSAATYAIDKPYDYSVPEALADRAVPGVRVMVPFGRGNRRCEGVILAVSRNSRVERRKAVLSLLDDGPVLDQGGLKLALWMRERYFCTVYEAVKAILPAGLWFSMKDSCRIAPGVEREAAYAAADTPAARLLLDTVYGAGEQADWDKIRAAFEDAEEDPSRALRLLTDRGVLVSETHAFRAVADKTEQVASLAVPAEEALELAAKKKKSAPVRAAALELLAAMGSASVKELCYYTGASAATARALEKAGVLTLERREVFRAPRIPAGEEPGEPVVLNAQQQAAFEGIDALCAGGGKPAAALLEGVTGSGKTMVYIRLLEENLKRGKTALVLVPEIALTPQLLRVFSAYFPDRLAVLHSSLRVGERYDQWKRIRRGEVDIVVGTRSAVFAPLPRLGLIVLDEEQEYSYQSENTPRYHARDVAKYRCAREGAVLLLGSATPSVESRYGAESGAYHGFYLSRRYNERELPPVLLADMREELKAGNGGTVSRLLRSELQKNLAAGRQSILFINRRGNSRMIACGECGTVPHCPNCSVPLTYHSANGRLMCHYCGHSERLPEACPECGGHIKFIGAGTQKVQEELSELFPGTEILRMDTDTISAATPHDALLERFRKRKIPILVGTQMVAKGLDFENVTLVGVIAADLSLYADNYRARERTFSLLTQVIGRAGRGEAEGRAVVQTFTPDNEVIRFAAAQDYEEFYRSEIGLRRARRCPPFADLFTLTVTGTEEEQVLRGCLRLRRELERALAAGAAGGTPPEILGPAPAAVARVNNRYRYRLTLAGRNEKSIRSLVAELLRSFRLEKANRGLAAFAEVNGLD